MRAWLKKKLFFNTWMDIRLKCNFVRVTKMHIFPHQSRLNKISGDGIILVNLLLYHVKFKRYMILTSAYLSQLSSLFPSGLHIELIWHSKLNLFFLLDFIYTKKLLFSWFLTSFIMIKLHYNLLQPPFLILYWLFSPYL